MTQKGLLDFQSMRGRFGDMPWSCLLLHVFCALESLLLWLIQLNGLCPLALSGKGGSRVHIGTPREEKWIMWLRPVIQGPESLKEKSLVFTLGR